MPDIMVLLACLSQCIEPTPLRQLGRVIEAMLSMSGRVTMRGLARWSGKGGSYRTIQRFFNTSLNWCHLNWLLIRHHVLDADDVVLMSGDHVVVTKSGKMTYGLDRFFSSLYGKTVPGLCFLSLSLLSWCRDTFSEVTSSQRVALVRVSEHDTSILSSYSSARVYRVYVALGTWPSAQVDC